MGFIPKLCLNFYRWYFIKSWYCLIGGSWCIQFQDITRLWPPTIFSTGGFLWWRNSCHHLSLYPTSTWTKWLKVSAWKTLKRYLTMQTRACEPYQLWKRQEEDVKLPPSPSLFLIYTQLKQREGGYTQADDGETFSTCNHSFDFSGWHGHSELVASWTTQTMKGNHVAADLQVSELTVSLSHMAACYSTQEPQTLKNNSH